MINPPFFQMSQLKMSRHKVYGSLALLGVSLVVFLAFGCAADHPAERGRPPAPPPLVEAVAARSGSLPLEERLTGVLKAQNQVAIRPQISATVVEVLARNGESVAAGQPLVRLDESTVREQLRQAEADLNVARASLVERSARVAELEAQVTRTRRLHQEALISELELERLEAQVAAIRATESQAQARVEQALATVDERRTALGRTVVRAPVAGRVGERNAEVGMLAGSDTVLFVIGNLETLIAEIPLTEEMLGYLEVGQAVDVTAPSLGSMSIRSTLSRISPFLSESSFSTLGEIDIANRDERLKPGMFVTVDVLYGESEIATLLPTSTLWEDPASGALGVYVAPEMGQLELRSQGEGSISGSLQRMEFRPIDIVAEGRTSIGLRGVGAGEWVVTVGQHMLADDEAPEAEVRVTTWDRVLELQELQREDVLRSFLDKQQRLTREGASFEGGRWAPPRRAEAP